MAQNRAVRAGPVRIKLIKLNLKEKLNIIPSFIFDRYATFP